MYVNKKDEVRFHCFGACKTDWDLYDMTMLRKKNRFKSIWNYLACRAIEEDTIHRFKIGYAPPYGDEEYQGRALIAGCFPRFEKEDGAFHAFSESGLVRFLNDQTMKGYGYYCRQIDFRRKDPFSRNYGDYFAGRIVFPVYDADACPTGFVGRCPGDRGVRWFKHQTREIALSTRGWLYGIEKAGPYFRQYRTIILVEGIFDYFAFYNLLQDQDKPVVVSTLGSYLTPEAATDSDTYRRLGAGPDRAYPPGTDS